MQFRLLTLLTITLFFFSCQKDNEISQNEILTPENKTSNFNSELISIWNHVYLTIEKDLPAFRPSGTSRAIGYIHLAAYETCLPGMPEYVSNTLKLNGLNIPAPSQSPSELNWNVALNACYATTFKYFLQNMSPEHIALIEKTEQNMGLELRDKMFNDVYDNSTIWGKTVAQAVIRYAETDLQGTIQSKNAFPTDYLPPSGDGKWVPTAPDYTTALFPYWGKVRTFIAQPIDLTSYEPIPFSNSPESPYYLQHKQLNDLVNNLSATERWKAEFWSDDIVGLTYSPPARIISLGDQMLVLEKMNLEDGLHFFCKLGMAINDGAVAAWNAKYYYNTERPETYIKKYINPNFKSILGEAIGRPGLVPPFPGYPSGHSTFGGIQAEIFNEFFGIKYTFTDRSHEGRTEFLSAPRTYKSWNEMAEENAYSRIALGVHIKMDCDEGIRLGRVIAKRVNAYRLKRN